MILDPLRLTSPANPLLKDLRRARERGSLTSAGLWIAEGPHLIDEAIRSGRALQQLFATSATALPAREVYELSPELFTKIAGTETPQGLLALVEPPLWRPAELLQPAPPLILFLDGVQDPGNAGTLVRTAEAFGFTGVVFGAGTASPWNGKTLRASAGSLFRIPFLIHQDDWLAAQPLTSYGALPEAGRAPEEIDWTQGAILAIGSEGRGLSPAWRERIEPVRIPTHRVESLNAAVAGAILMYAAARRRSLA